MKLLTNFIRFLLFLFNKFNKYIESHQLITVFLQKCQGTCNEKYCNISIKCRPLNRTSKRTSTDIYINQGVSIEAPINFEVITYKKFRTVYRQNMIKFTTELCSQLISMDHPFFRAISGYLKSEITGNMLDPCPLRDHRYTNPYIPSYGHSILMPVGEWKMDFILSKNINNSDVFLMSWSTFYEIKPTSAEEF